MSHEVNIIIPDIFPIPACFECIIRRKKVAEIFRSRPPGTKRSMFESITTECRVVDTGVEMKHSYIQHVQLTDNPTSQAIVPGGEISWVAVVCPEYAKHHQPKDGVILYSHE